MTIGKLSKESFLEKLHGALKPSEPIESLELLFGRDSQINDLESALYPAGRNVFIYGDRGVGKTSLAHTLAFKLQKKTDPIIVGCSGDDGLVSVVKRIVYNFIEGNVIKNKNSFSISAGFSGLSFSISIDKEQEKKMMEINNTSSACDLLREIEKLYGGIDVFIVIDEFDQIQDLEERKKFGMLIKQLGDNKSRIKLIFTGISKSLTELIGGHQSSERHIVQVKLEPITWDARFALIRHILNRFSLTMDPSIEYKISALSDGFPHYIHLILEHILNTAYNMPKDITNIDSDLFLLGLDKAIRSVAESLRNKYSSATECRDVIYHHILWSMADSADFFRHKTNIYTSYQSICKQLNISAVDNKKLSSKINNLTKLDYGEIIVRHADGKRPGWYEFSESIIRGYVRMIAEMNNIDLDFQENHIPNTNYSRVSNKKYSSRKMSPQEYQLLKERGELYDE
ncbi:AAA family ATPase [Gilliamella sp. N-G2]|uniref:AAA family ATPase n=1 Tax=Gilliamella sp. N-G2 TaxID=1970471 RepID=UPI000A33CAF7|nr:AAA family ATPase [Gilliamella sp. N-G2]OTQ71031.1 hypothetical protein B6C99_12545 [Gilliamella sp. N-G2]